MQQVNYHVRNLKIEYEVNIMNKEMVSLKIDEAMVSSVLEKEIAAAIVAQLGDQNKLITSAVRVALSKKVDINGDVSKYDYDNKHDLLERLATNSIHDAAKEALQEWLQENSVKIKEAVFKELKDPGRQRKIANAYADAIEKSLTCQWNMSCNIQFKERED